MCIYVHSNALSSVSPLLPTAVYSCSCCTGQLQAPLRSVLHEDNLGIPKPAYSPFQTNGKMAFYRRTLDLINNGETVRSEHQSLVLYVWQTTVRVPPLRIYIPHVFVYCKQWVINIILHAATCVV